MKSIDVIIESLVAVIALTALNRLVFHDGMLISIGYSVAIMASFWLGRLFVRLLRRRLMLRNPSR